MVRDDRGGSLEYHNRVDYLESGSFFVRDNKSSAVGSSVPMSLKYPSQWTLMDTCAMRKLGIFFF